MRTIVFVDGYNLYYGMLRRSPYKWLDLFALFHDHALNTEADVIEVRYCTAPVLGKMCDDAQSPQRQRTYLQALRKMPPQCTVIVEGKMIASQPYQRLVRPLPHAPEIEMVQVINFDGQMKTRRWVKVLFGGCIALLLVAAGLAIVAAKSN